MSSNNSPALELEPSPPRRLWLCAMLAVGMGVPWIVPVFSWELSLIWCALNAAVIVWGWRGWKASLLTRVLWDGSGHWSLIDVQGRRTAAELRPDSVVCGSYLWLKWNCDGRRRQRFVLPGDCSTADWRRWQARLHWQGRAFSAEKSAATNATVMPADETIRSRLRSCRDVQPAFELYGERGVYPRARRP